MSRMRKLQHAQIRLPMTQPFCKMISGKAPAMAAMAYHRATGRRAAQPNQRLGYGENFLYMLDAGAKGAYKPNPRLARAIEILFILHAEHEMNCSTAAVR